MAGKAERVLGGVGGSSLINSYRLVQKQPVIETEPGHVFCETKGKGQIGSSPGGIQCQRAVGQSLPEVVQSSPFCPWAAASP